MIPIIVNRRIRLFRIMPSTLIQLVFSLFIILKIVVAKPKVENIRITPTAIAGAKSKASKILVGAGTTVIKYKIPRMVKTPKTSDR
jgi:hypothetical protein